MPEILGGRYELLDVIGAGGAGTVWRARDLRTDQVVAAKVMRQSNAWSLLRFVRETGFRIHHPHVLVPLGWVGEDDRVVLAMPLVDGGSVATLVGDNGALPPRLVAELLRQLLSALATVHHEGVIHRDIKPANLLLRATGTERPHLLVSDFGIATDTTGPRLTTADLVLGTPGYLAPEMLTGAIPDVRQDLFAVGAVAREMLTGERAPVIAGRLPGPTGPCPPGIPASLWQLVTDLTEPDPKHRVTSAGEALGRLDAPELAWTPDALGEVEVLDQLSHLPSPNSDAATAVMATPTPHGSSASSAAPGAWDGPAPDAVDAVDVPTAAMPDGSAAIAAPTEAMPEIDAVADTAPAGDTATQTPASLQSQAQPDAAAVGGPPTWPGSPSRRGTTNPPTWPGSSTGDATGGAVAGGDAALARPERDDVLAHDVAADAAPEARPTPTWGAPIGTPSPAPAPGAGVGDEHRRQEVEARGTEQGTPAAEQGQPAGIYAAAFAEQRGRVAPHDAAPAPDAPAPAPQQSRPDKPRRKARVKAKDAPSPAADVYASPDAPADPYAAPRSAPASQPAGNGSPAAAAQPRRVTDPYAEPPGARMGSDPYAGQYAAPEAPSAGAPGAGASPGVGQRQPAFRDPREARPATSAPPRNAPLNGALPLIFAAIVVLALLIALVAWHPWALSAAPSQVTPATPFVLRT